MSIQLQLQTKAAQQPSFKPVRTDILQRKCTCGQHTVAGGECEECRRKSGGMLHRAAASPSSVNGVPPIVHDVLSSSGQPLDAGTRAFMEPRFGHDFSQVRVHTDARAAESAQAVNALAYTVGRDVVFGTGQYAPGTSDGKRLIAHELSHVVQQSGGVGGPQTNMPINEPGDQGEREAEYVEKTIDDGYGINPLSSSLRRASSYSMQRLVRPENVSCHEHGLTNPNLTGAEAVAAIQAADAEAITLALRAELLLDFNLLLTQAGEPVDTEFDTILQEELGLTLTNPAHYPLIRQQINRFRRVRETLESGILRYICRGSTTTPIAVIGCAPAPCGTEFASSCPGNRLIVLCQPFWANPEQRAATILHEPFHIWFDMARHATNALRRADATCFESFALRVAGQEAFASCVGHTAG